MGAPRGNPYHDRRGRFTTGGGAEVVSDLADQQRQATVAVAGTASADAPGTAPRPTPPDTPPVFTADDGGTAIHVRDGPAPAYEVWRNGEMIESVPATRAWRKEKSDLIAKYTGPPRPPSASPDTPPVFESKSNGTAIHVRDGATPMYEVWRDGELIDTLPATRSWRSEKNSLIEKHGGEEGAAHLASLRPTYGRPGESEPQELARLLSEEALFADPTGDAVKLNAKAGALARTWHEYGQQYGEDIFADELARARRAAGGRARALSNTPSIRQELELTNLMAENRLAENPTLNRDKLYAQMRDHVMKVSAQGLGKYNELLTNEGTVWYEREQAIYGEDIERETEYWPFDDGGDP